MAKKKKGNMKNIQSGDTVQFLNYLTPDHILRGKYNTGNNELDITDVPANLNSVITLGQGGGSSFSNPTLKMKCVNNAGESYTGFGMPQGIILNNEISKSFVDNTETLSDGETKSYDLFVLKEHNTNVADYYADLIYPINGTPTTVSSEEVNCTYDEDFGVIVITDPTKDASITVTYTPGE